jgi:hypothetical protein
VAEANGKTESFLGISGSEGNIRAFGIAPDDQPGTVYGLRLVKRTPHGACLNLVRLGGEKPVNTKEGESRGKNSKR